MAVTKIWPVRGRLDAPLNYISNPEKTKALEDVMNYAVNEKKTEKHFYVSGINCDLENARNEFIKVKKYFRKEDGIIAYHGYQSFMEGEVTPYEAHQIGIEFAKKVWGDDYQVVVATHLNTDCLHNHFVINSVSFKDGYKLQKARWYDLSTISDEICKAHGISIVNDKTGKGLPKYMYEAEKKGKPTRLNMAKEAVDAVKNANSDKNADFKLSVTEVKSNANEVRLQLTASVGNQKVTNFNGGTVEVSVKLPAGLAKKDLQAVYIDDNGKATKVDGIKNADGTFTMILKHFSEYAIMSAEDAALILPKMTDEEVKAVARKMVVTTRTENLKKGIKVYVNEIEGLDEIKDAGYEVTYDFYKAVKKKAPKNKEYKLTKVKDKKDNWYLNTAVKKGSRYYYKVILKIKDSEGNLVASTKLSNAKYGYRTRK